MCVDNQMTDGRHQQASEKTAVVITFRLQAVFLAWQERAELLAGRRQGAHAMQLCGLQSFTRGVLREWRLETVYQQGLKRAAAKGLRAQQRRWQGQALASWSIHVHEQR